MPVVNGSSPQDGQAAQEKEEEIMPLPILSDFLLGGISNIGGFGAFGLSNIRVGMTGEVERARLDILERMKRTTDSRAKSRLTLPRLFGDGKKETNILADVL